MDTPTHNSLREKKGSMSTPNKEEGNSPVKAQENGEESHVHELVDS